MSLIVHDDEAQWKNVHAEDEPEHEVVDVALQFLIRVKTLHLLLSTSAATE